MLGEVLTASVTPFDADGSVSLTKFRELASYLVDNVRRPRRHGDDGRGAHAHRRRAARALRRRGRNGRDRATVVAGTGTYDTRHSVHLTEKAHELGVDGFVVTPYYNKPPPRGIVEHVKAIASVTDKPIVYYNIPARVVNLVSVETLAELAEIPNVVAVKQAWDDLEDARRIVEETGLQLYAGDDNILLSFLEVGGVGGICVHTHVVGPQVKEQVTRFKQGDTDAARRIEDELAPAYEILKAAVNPIGIKAAQPPRSRRRRAPAPARRGQRRGTRDDPRLSRAPRRTRASLRLDHALLECGEVLELLDEIGPARRCTRRTGASRWWKASSAIQAATSATRSSSPEFWWTRTTLTSSRRSATVSASHFPSAGRSSSSTETSSRTRSTACRATSSSGPTTRTERSNPSRKTMVSRCTGASSLRRNGIGIHRLGKRKPERIEEGSAPSRGDVKEAAHPAEHEEADERVVLQPERKRDRGRLRAELVPFVEDQLPPGLRLAQEPAHELRIGHGP